MGPLRYTENHTAYSRPRCAAELYWLGLLRKEIAARNCGVVSENWIPMPEFGSEHHTLDVEGNVSERAHNAPLPRGAEVLAALSSGVRLIRVPDPSLTAYRYLNRIRYLFVLTSRQPAFLGSVPTVRFPKPLQLRSLCSEQKVKL